MDPCLGVLLDLLGTVQALAGQNRHGPAPGHNLTRGHVDFVQMAEGGATVRLAMSRSAIGADISLGHQKRVRPVRHGHVTIGGDAHTLERDPARGAGCLVIEIADHKFADQFRQRHQPAHIACQAVGHVIAVAHRDGDEALVEARVHTGRKLRDMRSRKQVDQRRVGHAGPGGQGRDPDGTVGSGRAVEVDRPLEDRGVARDGHTPCGQVGVEPQQTVRRDEVALACRARIDNGHGNAVGIAFEFDGAVCAQHDFFGLNAGTADIQARHAVDIQPQQ